MKTLRLAPAARSDLAEIHAFSRKKWGLAQAEAYLRGLGAVFRLLTRGEKISRSAENIRSGYRRCAYRSHVIFFIEGDLHIDIVRILHQAMDFDSRLG